MPDDRSSKTFGSFRSILNISRGPSFFEARFSFIDLIALSIIVRVRSPKKSNLTRPIFSTSSLSNCVRAEDVSLSKYIGEKSESEPGAITTPPACFPIFLIPPSNLKDKSIIS